MFPATLPSAFGVAQALVARRFLGFEAPECRIMRIGCKMGIF